MSPPKARDLIFGMNAGCSFGAASDTAPRRSSSRTAMRTCRFAPYAHDQTSRTTPMADRWRAALASDDQARTSR